MAERPYLDQYEAIRLIQSWCDYDLERLRSLFNLESEDDPNGSQKFQEYLRLRLKPTIDVFLGRTKIVFDSHTSGVKCECVQPKTLFFLLQICAGKYNT